jgi:CRISPR/Cas system-associated endonuclease Cas1
MGIEGSIAKNYFAQWRRLWGKAWHFQERNRRLPGLPNLGQQRIFLER